MLKTVSTGIVIFGMIGLRHGTSAENITKLCRALDRYNVPRQFKVVIVGKTQDKEVVAELIELQKTQRRLVVQGPLDVAQPFNKFMRNVGLGTAQTDKFKKPIVNIAFNPISQCRYAISFDKAGYRDNASAMVNMTRAGNLLFSLESSESVDDLIQRCARTIVRCGHDGDYYTTLLAAQQPRFRATDPTVVGLRLSGFFAGLARVAARTGALPGLSVFNLSQTYIAYYEWAFDSAVTYCEVKGTIRISGKTRRGSGGKVYVEFVLLDGTMTAIAHGSPARSVSKESFAAQPLFINEDFLR